MQSKGIWLFLGVIAFLTWLSGQFLPHWSGVLYVLVLVGYLFRPSWSRALAGGLASALVWVVLAAMRDASNAGILSARIGAMMGVVPSLLWVITGGIGFLLGWLGLSLGKALSQILPQKPPRLGAR